MLEGHKLHLGFSSAFSYSPKLAQSYFDWQNVLNSLCYCDHDGNTWHYTVVLCLLLELQYIAVGTNFHAGCFRNLNWCKPMSLGGFSRYCSRGIFSPEVCRAHFQGGWSACCWEFTVSAPPYEQTFLSMSAFPCSACNAFLIPNATLCRKTFKCSDNNHHSMFQAWWHFQVSMRLTCAFVHYSD